MAVLTPDELRSLARRYREMAEMGQDWSLQTSVLLLAEEFDAEANRSDGVSPLHSQAVDWEQPCGSELL